MLRFWFLLLPLLALCAFGAYRLFQDPGYVLITFQGYSLESTLVSMVLAMVLVLVLLWVLMVILTWPFKFARKRGKS